MESVDYLVVGAGIAGLSVAARLAAHGTTVVCEAEASPGFHSSGRSAAFAHFDMDSALVRALTAASLPLLQEPAAHRHPALFIALEGQSPLLDRLETNYRQWAPQVQRLQVAGALERVPILREAVLEGALLDPDARKLDAHAMLEQHRKELVQSGGRIETNSAVLGLRQEAARWIVDTTGASYSAQVVVNAAGAWADEVAKLAGVARLGIAPFRRTVITFDVPQDLDVSLWPFTKTVGSGFYMEPEGRGRLLGCPMDESSTPPCDAQAEEEDVAQAAWRIEQATTLEVRRIASKWAGLRSFAPDRNPVCGFDRHVSGFFWLAGQGGFGLQTSPAMALAAEALATDGAWPDELLAVGVGREDLQVSRFR